MGPTQTEAELIQLSLEGDKDAFCALLTRHQDRLYRLCRRMVGTDEAEHVAQQTCVQAWQHLTSFQPGSVFATWLYRLGIDCCIEHLRNTNRFRAAPPLDSPDPLDSTPLTEQKQTVDLEQALEQLPADDRLLLHMRIVDELPYAVIGGMLGIEPGAVGSRLYRARARLYALLMGRLVHELP